MLLRNADKQKGGGKLHQPAATKRYSRQIATKRNANAGKIALYIDNSQGNPNGQVCLIL